MYYILGRVAIKSKTAFYGIRNKDVAKAQDAIVGSANLGFSNLRQIHPEHGDPRPSCALIFDTRLKTLNIE